MQFPNSARLPISGDFQFRILGIILDIAIDNFHVDGTSHYPGTGSGQYDEFYVQLQSPGYNLTTIDHQFSPSMFYDTTSDTTNIDMLVITEPVKEFTTTEMSILKRMVRISAPMA